MIHRRIVIVVATLGLVAFLRSAVGAAELDLADNGDTQWKIVYNPAEVQPFSFTGTPTDGETLDGTLSLDLVHFEDLSPIDIRFVQERAGRDNFGLRITMNLYIENDSADVWKGFRMELLDPSPEFEGSSSLHPGYAHFHNLGADGALSLPPFSLLSPANPSGTARTDVWVLGNGKFQIGDTNFWTGIGIHQWEQPLQDRSFTLRLTPIPIPEPSTLALVGISSALLLGHAWRRRKR